MPELPEVETVRRGLAPVMEEATIIRLSINRPDLRFPFPADFASLLEGQKILSLGRRAKYLLIDFENGLTLIAHLGMSGSFRIELDSESDNSMTPDVFHNERSKDGKHDHVVMHLDGPMGAARVIYNDPRRFGFMHLVERKAINLYPAFADLGPEPTGNALSADYLAQRFAKKKQPLKTVLLDQKIIAGLGNIYVCEALWRAGLEPTRAAASLVEKGDFPSVALSSLTAHIRDVISDAIMAGGSSLRDYIHADGTLGYFQHSFAVYDREGKACRRDGCTGTIARITQAGRSTFYCSTCQR